MLGQNIATIGSYIDYIEAAIFIESIVRALQMPCLNLCLPILQPIKQLSSCNINCQQ